LEKGARALGRSICSRADVVDAIHIVVVAATTGVHTINVTASLVAVGFWPDTR
jgi:hypothetical protein